MTIVFGRDGNAQEATVFGWSAAEDGYTWTIGHRAVLCTSLPDAPQGYMLEITWSPYLGPLDAQRVGVSVGGRRVAERAVRDLESARFACPAPLPHERRLLIEFDLPDAAAPSAIAGHHDDRVLALCFRWIKFLLPEEPPSPKPARPTLTLVAEGEAAVAAHTRGWPTAQPGLAPQAGDAGELDVLFGTGGNAERFLGAGWYGPEPGYLWTQAGACRLVLPRPPAARAADTAWELEIELQPFVASPSLPAQRLVPRVNAEPCGEIALSGHAVIRLDLPWPMLQAVPAIDLTCDLPDAACPMHLPGGTDSRMLAFAFKRLRLFPGPPPAALHPAPPAAITLRDMPADRLMLQFESLGENCEFGLVQRACGAEPLGLLRFASAPLPKLLAALRARFRGLGDADNIDVQLSPNGREYMIHDHAFGFRYHAWVLAGEKTPTEIRAREVRRVPFLVAKLIDDLTTGEKIFVYHGMQPLSLANARSLVRVIRDYGPSTLLWVELADAQHTCGTVEWVEEGLLKGYIDRFAPGENAHDFAKESWVSLCRYAASRHRGLRTADV